MIAWSKTKEKRNSLSYDGFYAAAENKHKDWIPLSFQKAAEHIAKDAIEQYVSANKIIGLGSGPMAEAIIREMRNLSEDVRKTIHCIPSSTQIKHAALESDLLIVDENMVPNIDIVFDGADQIDSKFNMIKGGGGALLKEKVLHSGAKTIVITAESFKFLKTFDRSIPVEVHPFALYTSKKRLESEYNGRAELRLLDEGYPYVTENGNFILDTFFESIPDVKEKEEEIKNIPGILEVGLFTKAANVYYKANEDGSFEKIKP